ncbi:medium-chain fatty acid-CoA ligase faa2 [Coemansia thaxteri]|uniref:Medium-chain fatty acid-CoA ligase faa2 n=1 Tax=Coemansia thaxteri TaxID=2663907 RepID=A0A9W8BG66_9FUNG|nr:medium-chain fatty acid-CoA ligase faa2 [Coemansia thaxteri]KAJ2004250.1 medium-chain fatty acid-CoA ligase faa2 [Coemansia thaxteri]KAJ2471190.1 medium-chain fatty acid-CoA ligase faa2 [Coemansia sp. RSA 2322]KAJ2486344.1 medium-chain fatty acid-CoA ligase faa2 [Coemansia sp. RSA 2320]
MAPPKGSTIQCSIELPGAPDIPGETKPYINFINTDGKLVSHMPGVNSLYDNFLRGRGLAGKNSPAFGYRPTIDGMGNVGPYRWLTWDLFHERFVNLSSGLRQLGMQAGDRIGIYMSNSIEWVLVEFATYYQRLVSVPIYEALGPDVLAHVVAQSGMAVVVCSSDNARRLLGMADRIPAVRDIVVADAPGPDLIRLGNSQGVAIRTLRAIEDAGAKQPIEPEKLPMPGDTATIIYTSGTVGMPKGVVLTHANLLASTASVAAMQQDDSFYTFTPRDCNMGFLPLAHCLGRMVMHLMVAIGVKTAFPRSDPAKLVEDLRELQPTVFVGVPRIFNRIQDRVLSTVQVKGGLPLALFQYAYSTKKNNLSRGQISHWLWDRVIFKPLRDKFGGKLSLIVSGSAPISPETLEFLRCCFSCNVIEGYGLSETVGPTSVTLIDDIEPGNVGAPLPCAMMKLRSVPDLGYVVDDKPYPRGEILVRGSHVFSEYYGLPDKTREAFTDDGWLCTGDIGMVDERGRFHIVDRRNNMFKLAQGMFVTPEKIENIYSDHFIVNQAFVYGDSLQSSLVAVIVPDAQLLRMFLKNKGVVTMPSSTGDGTPDFVGLCSDPVVNREVVAELSAWGKTHGLAGFEIPKKAYLSPVQFEEVGLFTPTFKLKRRMAIAHFKNILDGLYAQDDLV